MKRIWVVFAIVFLGSTVMYPLMPGSRTVLIFGNIIQMLSLIYAAGNLTDTASEIKNSRLLRKGWVRLAVGTWIWVLSQLMESYCEIILEIPAYGTVGDNLWLLGYLVLTTGLAFIFAHLCGKGMRVASKDFLLPGILLFCFLLVFVLGVLPQITDPGRSISKKIVDIAYPAFDFALAILSAFLLTIGKERFQFAGPYAYFFVGFILLTGADLGLSYFSGETSLDYQLLDIPYFSCYFLMALAAKRQSELLKIDKNPPLVEFSKE